MDRLISEFEVIRAIEKYVDNIFTKNMGALINDIKAIPSAEPCEDAISRQAVLSYIYNDLGLGDEENGADIERQMELERSYKYVKSLSSVNPQPICEEREKGECPYYAG